MPKTPKNASQTLGGQSGTNRTYNKETGFYEPWAAGGVATSDSAISQTKSNGVSQPNNIFNSDGTPISGDQYWNGSSSKSATPAATTQTTNQSPQDLLSSIMTANTTTTEKTPSSGLNLTPSQSWPRLTNDFTYEPTGNPAYDAALAEFQSASAANQTALGKLRLQKSALGSISMNVDEVDRLQRLVAEAYSKGVYNTEEIANGLGVSVDAVRLIQQGKANELVDLSDEYKKEQMMESYWSLEDTEEAKIRARRDFELNKEALNQQWTSAITTLERTAFDQSWTSKIGGAVVGTSGVQYMIDRLQSQYDQNMQDINSKFATANTEMNNAYNDAIKDYTKQIERIGYSMDQQTKQLQQAVLTNLININTEIGATATEQLAALKAYEAQISSAKSTMVSNRATALDKAGIDVANQVYGDLSSKYDTTVRAIRNNNPTAFTTDVAKSLGLVEWVDYVVGDKFPGDSNLYTARLLADDPIQFTLDTFDKVAADPNRSIFYTQSGKQRWKYIAMTDEEWSKLDEAGRTAVMKKMAAKEAGANNYEYFFQPKSTESTTGDYYNANPMDPIFAQYQTNAKTWDERSAIGAASNMYTQVYKLANDGWREAFMNAGDWETALTQLVADSPDQKISGAGLMQSLTNKMGSMSPELRNAFLDMIRVVEIKLRVESGAAISNSEWATNFMMYLPQSGDSPATKSHKLEALNDMVQGFAVSGGIPKAQYIPITLPPKKIYTPTWSLVYPSTVTTWVGNVVDYKGQIPVMPTSK